MTAFTVKVVTDWDPQKPLTTTKLNQLYDNTQYCKDLIGSHLHTGSDGSALIPVGPNYLRNPSFEADTSGWTLTPYTGGTVARVTTTNLDGAASLAFTSTVLANGGGDAVSDEYIPVTQGNRYSMYFAIMASVANVSAKVELLWYDKAKAAISSTLIYSYPDVPTTLTEIGTTVTAPANARFMLIKLTGGVPALGSATGTIYFDGLNLSTAKSAPVTAYLGANISSIGNVFVDGPTIAQGPYGQWFVSGGVVVSDISVATTFFVKLWDGTTVIDSKSIYVGTAGSSGALPVSLSGYIDSPVGNLRISVKEITGGGGSGTMYANESGSGKDSSITAIRVG